MKDLKGAMTFMKKIVLYMLCLSLISLTVHAGEGEMGHMGGVASGSNLPKTIEKYVNIPTSTTNSYVYKEVIFLSGSPVVFEGTIEVSIDTTGVLETESGSYTESYTVEAVGETDGDTLERSISYTMDYRVIDNEFKKQVVPTMRYNSLNWEETIVVEGSTYTLDSDSSSYTIGGVTHVTPGVEYYSSDVSYVAQYTDADGNNVVVESSGTNVGYNQPWSQIENQDRFMELSYGSDVMEDMSVRTSSFMEAKKTLYYSETEPFPISFDGTYNQRYERESILSYEILTFHKDLDEDLYQGNVLINTANQIEKLPIPEELDFVEGHWAEEDFKKLYSMEIFTEIPHQGMQYEAINRGDFIKALCLAMNIDVTDYEDGEEVIFGDVQPDHPHYPYIMAAYDKKLIKGTGAIFDIDRPINREEAFVVYIRVIGLERLGVTESPITPFTDDNEISSWAKKEIMAGFKLGIIQGDTTGKVKPQQWISKSEAAAIINRLVDYLREDIGQDYRK